MENNPMVPKSTPRDFFMYLLVTGTLYAGIVGFLALLFAYVDVLQPDKLAGCYDCALSQIRWSSSELIVVFPIFMVLFWLLGREYAVMPEKRDIKVRRWLAWFTLFLSAITVIVDLITLVYNFYNGDLTTNFALKILAVLFVALAVFGFYLKDLRGAGFTKRGRRLVGGLTALIVLVAIVGGFFLVGSPSTQRARRFDQQRVGDLQNIQSQVINYWQNKSVLPGKLDNLTDNISGWTAPLDPQTQQPYEYRVTSPTSRTFELCATFQAERPAAEVERAFGTPSPETGDAKRAAGDNLGTGTWDHTVGRTCFTRTIDPDLYKLNKLPPLGY